jgi:hypothetical protein
MRIKNFKPAVLSILTLVLLFWGFACVQTWVAVSRTTAGDEAVRLPSSYDAGKPLMQVADEANGKPLLVEFYTNRCLRCTKVVPIVHEFAKTPVASQCFTLALVNAELAENKLFTDLFAVKEVPALFIFNPTKMKKTPVILPPATQPPPTQAVIAQAVWQALKTNTDGAVSRHCGLIVQPTNR